MATVLHVDPSPRVRSADEDRRPPRGDLELIAHVNQALALLQGKWKVHLLFFMARGIHRHGRLLDCLSGASKKVMIDTLRALERDGLVDRRVFAEVPVRVEYSLTKLGWSMTEPLMSLSDWSEEHGEAIVEAQARCAATRNGHAGGQVDAERSAAA
jgi:DNA-binding HxlR family transcriptional regulator